MTLAEKMIAENGRWIAEQCPGCKVQHEQLEAHFDCELVGGKPRWHLVTQGAGCNWVRTSPYMTVDDAALSLAAAGYEIDRPFDPQAPWMSITAHLPDTTTERTR